MKRDLSRLLRPRSIALFGGGWAANVVQQLQKSGYDGEIWPVNPRRTDLHGVPCLASIEALPAAPDAAFVGVNREASVEVVRQLAAMGAGGATCFASGFRESEGESAGGTALQEALVEAAGGMAILGPNCYGLLNYLDNVTLWPDQHGGLQVGRGVGIIAQSSNVAINMTMQARGLPIAYMIAAGNQAQTGIAEIGEALIADDRVSAVGLYLEGFGDIRALEALAARARAAGKPVVALKVGRSEKARTGTLTHTASLAGSAAAASALLRRLGFMEVSSVGVFLETLKLLHFLGPMEGNQVCSISCSGGEASLMADMAEGTAIEYRDFSAEQRKALKGILGPIVTIANPLDYHTFIWGDTERMTGVFAAGMADGYDLVICVLDLPRADRCDPSSYQCAIDAIIAARKKTGAKVALLATLPENINEALARHFADNGVVVLHGMEEGIAAIDAAIRGRQAPQVQPPLLIADGPGDGHGQADHDVLDELSSKAALAAHGLRLPKSAPAAIREALAEACAGLSFPVVLKAAGIAHKSEAGGVVIGLLDAEAVAMAAAGMDHDGGYLVEEMVAGGVAELLIGVTRDETGLFLLTVGSGGVMTELLDDTASLLLPALRDDIRDAISGLRLGRLLAGFRGRPAADMEAVLDAVEAVCRYAQANAATLQELDVNPLIVREHDAIAVDALISHRRKLP